MISVEIVDSGATFDSSQKYRYNLWRTWNECRKRAAFVMLNPSRADVTYNDQTIRSCISFANLLGYGSLEVVNLFAYRTPDPLELRAVKNPVGKQNDEYIMEVCERADVIILGWGNHGSLLGRSEKVLTMLNSNEHYKIRCLGETKLGHPRHPLYLKHTMSLQPFVKSSES